MCCSPWGRKESDMTGRLNNSNNDTGVLGLIVTGFWFELFSYLGHSASLANPLECSCLENPRDGRAWWAAISGVAQSRTRLKRLLSSSSSS